MERKLASIQQIANLSPIEGADRIELATVLGWQCVVKKGDFNVGDRCVYFELDSSLPNTPMFSFLSESDRKRLKTRKFKGEVSQGLVMPVPSKLSDLDLGTDVSESLGVTKYDPPQSFNIGEARSSRPWYVPKTDEIRVQSIPDIIDELWGQPYYITQKLDGSSMSVAFWDDGVHVCSRNMDIRESDNSLFWKTWKKYDLDIEYLFEKYGYLVIQGELVGPSIQKNRMGLTENEFYVFDIWSPLIGRYLEQDKMVRITKDLGLNRVPFLLHGGKFNFDLDFLLKFAMMDTYPNAHPQEGIVVRHPDHIESKVLKGDRLSFKVINNDYLLKVGE